MKYQFTAYGHKNITAQHKSTLEWTRQDFCTPQGDCIVGTKATYNAKKLQAFTGKVRARMLGMDIIGFTNPAFSHDTQMVLRTSDFASSRTFLVRCNKAAKDVPARKRGKYTVQLHTITHKAVFFDFDNTLEDWNCTDQPTHDWLYTQLIKKTKLPMHSVIDYWKQAKARVQQEDSLKKYNRYVWLKEFFTSVHVSITKQELQQLTDTYWQLRMQHARLFVHVKELLSALKKKNYKLALLSDSDGAQRYKMMRINKFGLAPYFDAIIIGEDVGTVKPSEKFFTTACKKLHVKPYEAIMVGDHPRVDHADAKALGITTVWVRQGSWASQLSHAPSYVDYSIDHVREVEMLVKDLK